MKIFTIGFTKKSLEEFVKLLKDNKIQVLIDIRLRNTGQLAGFAKDKDLKFILNNFGIEYRHVKDLAPTSDLLDDYKNRKIDWEEYRTRFDKLMEERKGREILLKELEGGKTACLLCSEEKAEQCHRRLVAELVRDRAEIINL